jgi:hypothetical protein
MDGWMEFISPGGTEPIGPKHANYIRIDVTSPLTRTSPLLYPSFITPYASCHHC